MMDLRVKPAGDGEKSADRLRKGIGHCQTCRHFQRGGKRGSVQADGFDLAFRRIRHDRFAAVSEHDGRAVGRMQYEHAVTGWEQRRGRRRPEVWQRRLAFLRKISRREKRATPSSPIRRQAAEADGIASTA